MDWRNRHFKFIQAGEAWDMQFVQEKTNDPLQIPLSPIALGVLRRHGFEMPPVFSPPVTLKHLGRIAAAAGIEKHITTHTARRTFCTLQDQFPPAGAHIIQRIHSPSLRAFFSIIIITSAPFY